MEKEKEKDGRKNKWYKKGGHPSILLVTATSQSELRNQIQEEIDKTHYTCREMIHLKRKYAEIRRNV